MKSWSGILLTAALLCAGLATAAGYGRDFQTAMQGQHDRYNRDQPQPQRQRGYGRDERPQRQDGQRPQRLSDEERRELHRDLDKARREIYRPRRDR